MLRGRAVPVRDPVGARPGDAGVVRSRPEPSCSQVHVLQSTEGATVPAELREPTDSDPVAESHSFRDGYSDAGAYAHADAGSDSDADTPTDNGSATADDAGVAVGVALDAARVVLPVLVAQLALEELSGVGPRERIAELERARHFVPR